MSTLVKRRLDAWSTGASPPVAKVLTAAFVVHPGGSFKSRYADVLELHCTTAGTVTTSTDLKVEETLDGTTYAPLEVIDTVSGGNVDLSDGTWRMDGANGTHRATFRCTPGATLRVSAKRTGGDVDSTLIATGALWKS